jgi:hypothetical protein
LIKKLKDRGSTAGALLAQAVQCTQKVDGDRKKKRREREKGSPLKKLVALLEGKKKKKKKKKKREERRRQRALQHPLKPDPDGSGGSGSSSYGSDSDSERSGRRRQSDEHSELSYEPPLRRKAQREPGSVLEMLIRLAQEQLDRGALLETEGAAPSMTSGVKISTYFALLIRPYYGQGNPLLRELYALGQAIDLLRQGRLPETADALAARFIAVHTALSEGSWQTAAQLELYPLEPVQSATTATMLQAHKHKKLVQKSQGLYPGRWQPWSGKGKGGQTNDKGKKGEAGKGRGKGKTKNTKDQGWGQKGDSNPWKESKEDPPKK